MVFIEQGLLFKNAEVRLLAGGFIMPEQPRVPVSVGGMQDDHTWSKTIWVPQDLEGLFVDEDGLTKELAVEKRAIDAGERNQPVKTDTTLDETQMKICGRIFAGILKLNQFLAEQLGAALTAARDRRVRSADIDGVEEEVALRIESAISDRRTELDGLMYSQLSLERQLRAFAARNRLGRTAQYSESLGLTWAWLFGLFVVESLVNGSLLAAVMANGLAGGAMLAGIISAINIGLGLIAGLWGWRNLKHRQIDSRALGIVFTVVPHTAGAAWNIFIAHFREAAEILAGSDAFSFEFSELSQATADHFAASGLLGLTSIQAWALLILGLGVHFYAAKKGWDDIADRYPDYKRWDVLAKTAAADYEDALAEVRQHARASVEQVEADALAKAEAAQRWLDGVDELIDGAKQRCQEVIDSEDDWVSTGTQLLKTYRDINSGVRDKGSAPAYFRIYPTAKDYRERTFGNVKRTGQVLEQGKVIERGLRDLDVLRSEAAKAAKDANDLVQVVRRRVNAAIRGLDSTLATEQAALTNSALLRLNREADEEASREAVPSGAPATATT